MTPSIYINLEDDVSKIVARLKRTSAKQLVLVCPKRCFLFNDSINLRLLKKQTEALGKEVFILTMDDRGQLYAKEAGFGLKFLPKSVTSKSFSDIRINQKAPSRPVDTQSKGVFAGALEEIQQIAKKLAPEKPQAPEQPPVVAEQEAVQTPEPVLIPPLVIKEPVFAHQLKTATPPKKTKITKIVIGSIVLVLVLALLLITVVLPHATVAVYPKTESLTRDMEVSLSANVKSADLNALVMPASPISEVVNVNNKFQSQGKKQVGNKAQGTVKIYNFTKLPLNLKAATTILSVAGKNYSLVSDISGLKPTTYSNSKTKEVDLKSLGGSFDIQASDGGDDYNLPAGSRLEISNQVFGSNPQFLYAKTDTEISGGTTRYLSVLMQADVESAKTALQSQAIEQIREKLKSQGMLLPDKAFSLESVQFTSDAIVGSQTPSFTASLQAKINGLAFNQETLKTLVLGRISQTLDPNKDLQSKPDQTTFQIKSWDLPTQLAVLSVHFIGLEVYKVDLPNLTKDLVGKTENQVNELLKQRAEINKVEITLAPSWQRNFPFFARNIKVWLTQ